jgi:leucyl aminopeptidase
MKISLRTGQPLDVTADVVVALVPTLPTAKKKGALAGPLAAFDQAFQGELAKLITTEDFTSKKDQQLAVAPLGRIKAKKFVAYGLGAQDAVTANDVRTAFAKIARLANSDKAKSVVVVIPEALHGHLRALAEGAELGAYRFTKYLTGDRKPKAELAQLTVLSTGKFTALDKREVEIGQAIAAGVVLSRDLSNEPPNTIYPESLAEIAREVGKAGGLKTVVYDMKDIKKHGM